MKRVLLGLVVLGVCATATAMPRIPQDPAYHRLADRRVFARIPNTFDVVSNVPFLIVGGLGLLTLVDRKRAPSAAAARWPWGIFFVAAVATTAGSIYYHLLPNNARVVWDRLPIA